MSLSRLNFFTVTGAALLSASPVAAGAQSSNSVRVGTTLNDSYFEPFYAQDEGFFERAGLDVTVQPFRTGAAVTTALNKALTVPLDSADYAAALQNAVTTSVEQDPIHIWLYTEPRIFAYSPSVTGIPSDLVQQRWEGVSAGGS